MPPWWSRLLGRTSAARPALIRLEMPSLPHMRRVVLRGGLGDLRFGMNTEQARNLLGEPTRVETVQAEICWEYNRPSLQLTFMDVPGRGIVLVTLSARADEVEFLGMVWELNEQPVFDALAKHGVKQIAPRIEVQKHYWLRFSHGLDLTGCKGPPSQVEWTILPDTGRVEEIDWSGADQVG